MTKRTVRWCLWLVLIGMMVTSVPHERAAALAPLVRLKDISHVLEARENQLMGFGLVAGLRNTGDSQQTGFTEQALSNLLNRMGIVPRDEAFRSRNVAAVMVTAQIPPYLKSGQKIDVLVSSVGDASSLQGGALLATPLRGADGEVYVVAQGSLVVGGAADTASLPTFSTLLRSHKTVGVVPQGGLVERAIPVTMTAKNALTIVLERPDYTTAYRVVDALQNGGYTAVARDAGTVQVGYAPGTDVVTLMAKLENTTLRPDTTAKVVISERTGTIVIGEHVRLAPVAVAHGDIQVRIGGVELYSGQGDIAQNYTTTTSRLDVQQGSGGRLVQMEAGTNLSTLVNALNAIGASPKDLVAILQAIRAAGALSAELEVI